MFRFRLDGSSGVPPYLQLVHQVRQSLLLGYLQEGDRLPTVKDVAGDLAINPNTVVKAYRQLEHEGLDRRPLVGAQPRVRPGERAQVLLGRLPDRVSGIWGRVLVRFGAGRHTSLVSAKSDAAVPSWPFRPSGSSGGWPRGRC